MQFMQALCQWQHVIKYLPGYCCKGMLEKGVDSGSHALESFARWGQYPPANEVTPNYSGMFSLGRLTHRAINLSGNIRHLVFRSGWLSSVQLNYLSCFSTLIQSLEKKYSLNYETNLWFVGELSLAHRRWWGPYKAKPATVSVNTVYIQNHSCYL